MKITTSRGPLCFSLSGTPRSRESAELTLTNHGKKTVHVDLSTSSEAWTWDDRSMHFYARWRYEYPIPTRPMKDWNYVSVQGKGVFVGDNLSV